MRERGIFFIAVEPQCNFYARPLVSLGTYMWSMKLFQGPDAYFGYDTAWHSGEGFSVNMGQRKGNCFEYLTTTQIRWKDSENSETVVLIAMTYDSESRHSRISKGNKTMNGIEDSRCGLPTFFLRGLSEFAQSRLLPPAAHTQGFCLRKLA
jgi:hypothetical protein